MRTFLNSLSNSFCLFFLYLEKFTFTKAVESLRLTKTGLKLEKSVSHVPDLYKETNSQMSYYLGIWKLFLKTKFCLFFNDLVLFFVGQFPRGLLYTESKTQDVLKLQGIIEYCTFNPILSYYLYNMEPQTILESPPSPGNYGTTVLKR
jgi:hypothetical protein